MLPLFIQAAHAEGAAAATSSPSSMFMQLLLPIACDFYFMIIRPQSRRAKEHRSMIDSIKKVMKWYLPVVLWVKSKKSKANMR